MIGDAASGPELTRRQVLGLVVAGVVATGGGVMGVVHLTGSKEPTPEQRRLDSIRQIGAAHRRRLPPEEATEAALRAALPVDWGTHDGDEPWASLRSLAEQVDRELARYEVVEVGGWQLPVTAARAAALISLTH